MRLYRDIKEEQQRKIQEEEDRLALGASKEVIIVYEDNVLTNMVRKITRYLSLLLLLAFMGAAIVVFTMTIK